jgi:hypothetical protein
MTAAYVPGDFLAVLVPGTLLVWEPRPGISPDDVWKAAGSGGAIHELVSLLSVDGGWSNLPSFAIVRPEEGRVRILVRGDVDVQVSAPGQADAVVAAPRATTWAESVVDGASSVTVLAGDSRPAQALPLVSGVVTTCRFTWVLAGAIGADDVDLAHPAHTLRNAHGAAPMADPFADSEVPGITEIPELTQAPVSPPMSPPVGTPVAQPVETPLITPPAAPLLETPPATPLLETPPATPLETPVEHSVSYAFLFGGGDERSVSSAAVRPEAELDPDPGSDPEPLLEPAPAPAPIAERLPDPMPTPIVEPAPVPPSDPMLNPLADEPTGLISHAPWSLGGRAPRLGDHDDLTVSRASLGTPSPASPVSKPEAEPADGDGPLMLSVACPVGHRNGPDALTCRVCGEVVPPQTPVTVRRPPLGVLRIANGDQVPLDRLTIVGRLPKAHGMVGTELPRLVTVPAPNQDVSRSHLELRLDGWQVLAVDLDSLNGTVVTLPGRPPQRIRANLPLIVSPGTTLVLADEVTLTIEASAGAGA